MRRFFTILMMLVLATQAIAATTQSADDKEITAIIQQFTQKPHNSLNHKLIRISQHFLDRPYQLGPLGEGAQGRFDQHPLYRTDVFDCLTYVETVIALARSHGLNEFKQQLQQIRYRHGHIGFLNRNHFMTVDWIKNNEHQGYIRDITYLFHYQDRPLATIAEADINKPAWIKHFTQQQLHLRDSKPSTAKRRLRELHTLAKRTQVEKGVLLYLPIATCLQQGQLNPDLVAQLPKVAIMNIVRPDWKLKDKIGTNLNVSHVGLLIKQTDGVVFRHASLLAKRVVDEPLADYLARVQNSPTIKGINILAIDEGDAP